MVVAIVPCDHQSRDVLGVNIESLIGPISHENRIVPVGRVNAERLSTLHQRLETAD